MDSPETQTTLGTQDTKRRQTKQKGQSRMDSPETQTTLGTQDTKRRYTKQKRSTENKKKDKQHGPTKIISRRVSSWLLCAKHIHDNHYNNLTSNRQELTSASYSIRVSG